tara:strand:+ start:2093 stop:3205 length:1113 start_codon:yes stop_codon:yes gene_type:complete
MKYDYLVVGSGLFGSVFSEQARKKGKKVLIIEKRDHIGGNIYTENINGIQVHKYGPHIFHTNYEKVWNYVTKFTTFNRFTYMPMANFEGKYFNLPFNMNTFNQIWGLTNPKDVLEKIKSQTAHLEDQKPKNLEEQAIKLVGKDVYETLIKGYTEKQWGRKATELPPFIIKRLPVRFTFDNNYFNDKYQGIPEGGYTKLIESILEGIEVKTNTDFFKDKDYWLKTAKKIIFTGPIDEYYDYVFGNLEYRSLKFENEFLEEDNFQGCAVVNYTSSKVPFTRIIEHKHFDNSDQKGSIITKEYPQDWSIDKERYYPINDEKNNEIYKKYKELSLKDEKVYFGGRLAEYKYYDMHMVIGSALSKSEKILEKDFS